jgi:prevent-host-death family protein
MTQLNITDLRTHLRRAIEQVRAGEDIEIVQNGVVVAALVSPERLRPRIVTPNTRAAEALVKEMRKQRAALLASEAPLPPLGTLSLQQAASLLEEVKWHREHGDD